MKLPIAPKGVSSTSSYWDNIQFSAAIRDTDRKFIEELGFTLIDKNANGWLHITKSIIEHRDYIGHCLVYCSSGVGSLEIGRLRATLVPKSFTIFNDYDPHLFKPHTSHVNLMVVTVKQGTFRRKRDKFYPEVSYVRPTEMWI